MDDYHALNPVAYQLMSLVGAATDSITVSADENLSNMAQVFKRDHPQADVRRLVRAYRHDAPVARIVSGFAAHGSTTGLTPVTLQPISTSGGKPPVVKECSPDVVEIAAVIEETVRDWVQEGYGWSDIACVCLDSATTAPLKGELNRRGIPCVDPEDLKGIHEPALALVLNLLTLRVNPLDHAAFTEAVLARVGPGHETAISQMADQVLDKVRREGLDSTRAAEELARHFAPDDAVRQAIEILVAAQRELGRFKADRTCGIYDLVKRAVALCGVDPENNPSGDLADLLDIAHDIQNDYPGEIGNDVARLVSLFHPDLGPPTPTVGDGLNVMSVEGAGCRYWRAALVIDGHDPARDPAVADREMYLALSRATQRLGVIVAADSEEAGTTSNRHLAILKELEYPDPHPDELPYGLEGADKPEDPPQVGDGERPPENLGNRTGFSLPVGPQEPTLYDMAQLASVQRPEPRPPAQSRTTVEGTGTPPSGQQQEARRGSVNQMRYYPLAPRRGDAACPYEGRRPPDGGRRSVDPRSVDWYRVTWVAISIFLAGTFIMLALIFLGWRGAIDLDSAPFSGEPRGSENYDSGRTVHERPTGHHAAGSGRPQPGMPAQVRAPVESHLVHSLERANWNPWDIS